MSHAIDGADAFLDDTDRRAFLGCLKRVASSTAVGVRAYCLMGNHFHLLLQVEHVPLSRVMQQLLTRYSCYFNQRHERSGHLFRNRFTAKLCRRDSYLLTLIRYIHQNPVKDGFAAAVDAWPWSSHGAYYGVGDGICDPGPVLSVLADDVVKAKLEYLRLVGMPVKEEAIEAGYEPLDDDRPARSSDMGGPDLSELAAEIAGGYGVAPDQLAGAQRSGGLPAARRAFIHRAAGLGFSYAEIGRAIGRSCAYVSRTAAELVKEVKV